MIRQTLKPGLLQAASLAIVMALASVATPVSAATVTGMEVADTIDAGGTELVLNGAGARTKVVIKVYVGALYLSAKSKDAAAIVSADEPMAIRLYVTSKLLNAKRMKKALSDGFNNSTSGNLEPVQDGVDTMMGLLSGELKKGDEVTMTYIPGTGTVVSNGDSSADTTIEGLPFKQALFGIWLSDKPAQASLKDDMLGK